jgi:hypothetical protein
MKTVWAKTAYWSDELVRRLKGYETLNPRMWSQRGWDDSSGKNKQVSRFKPYTWARIFKSKDRGKDIFFTVGIEAEHKSLLYKIDYYATKESQLSHSQKELCKQLIPDEVSGIEVPYDRIGQYDWQKLLDKTETFVLDHDALYDEIIRSVWTETVNVSMLRNRLIKRETPKNGLKEIPKRKFSFKGHDTDWVKQQERNSDLGTLGEDLVIEYEKNELKKKRLFRLSNDVRKVKDGEGYDIFSRSENGRAKHIEVKTTNGNEDTPFQISINEVAFSKLNPDSYHLYRLFNVVKETRVAEFHQYSGNLRDNFLLEEIEFNAYRKAK